MYDYDGFGKLSLACKFGVLTCEVLNSNEEYAEFAIDLHRKDGKVVQVCVVGTVEGDWEPNPTLPREWNEHMEEYVSKIHVDLWDGVSEDMLDEVHYVEPFGDGWYGEEN